MASLFRPTYHDKAGQKRKAKKWYGQYVDADGITRRVPLSANKTAAQQMLNGLVRKSELGRVGIIDHFEEHVKRPLTEHLTAWEESLQARENTDKHVRMKLSRVRRIVELCKFRFVADLSASRIEAALADLREQAAAVAESKDKPDRFGTQTSNHYLAAVKQFVRWLVKDRRIADNPLAHLEGGNVNLDRRHERRELADDELTRLFSFVRSAESCGKLDGPDREMLYLVSAYTGFRASELASLKPESFNLDASTPTVMVEAAYSKHRREDVLPLHADLVGRLRPWLSGKAAGELIWPGKWAAHNAAGKILQRDLKRARAAWINEARTDAEREHREESFFLSYRDADGRVADFHALRHTFISRLVRSGARPKEAQTLARHSTITLTMDRYAHTGLHDVAAAVEAMPSIPSTGPELDRQVLQATGTDGKSACTVACTKLAQNADSSGLRLIVDDNAESADSSFQSERKPLEKKAVRKNRQRLIAVDSSAAPLAQLDRASVFGTEGYRFDSCGAYLFDFSRLTTISPRLGLNDISSGFSSSF